MAYCAIQEFQTWLFSRPLEARQKSELPKALNPLTTPPKTETSSAQLTNSANAANPQPIQSEGRLDRPCLSKSFQSHSQATPLLAGCSRSARASAAVLRSTGFRSKQTTNISSLATPRHMLCGPYIFDLKAQACLGQSCDNLAASRSQAGWTSLQERPQHARARPPAARATSPAPEMVSQVQLTGSKPIRKGSATAENLLWHPGELGPEKGLQTRLLNAISI